MERVAHRKHVARGHCLDRVTRGDPADWRSIGRLSLSTVSGPWMGARTTDHGVARRVSGLGSCESGIDSISGNLVLCIDCTDCLLGISGVPTKQIKYANQYNPSELPRPRGRVLGSFRSLL